mgnify:CR=1 FL=1
MEGRHCFVEDNCDQNGLERPFFEYNHHNGCSIIGGYVYHGAAFPALQGNYFAADYCWSLFPAANGAWLSNRVYERGMRISSFGEDANRELYVLDHVNSSIWQIGVEN